MSETAPRTNARLDNFDANKAAHEQAQYEDAVYGEAGKTDFSDEARRRVEEADAYERHLESMSARGEDYDEIANNLENSEYKDSVDRAINDDPTLRRMDMMARSIAQAYATEVTPENADRLPASIKDKEDKLQKLLIAFNDNSTLPEAQKEEIVKRIIDASENSISSTGEPEEEVATPEVVPVAEISTEAEASNEEISAVVPEGSPAEEGESLEEYEARYAVDPNLAIDPAEMPIAVPEGAGEAREEEIPFEFNRYDVVRVERSSGVVEDGWSIDNIGTGPNGRVYRVIKPDHEGDNLVKIISAEDLVAMQALEVSAVEADGARAEQQEDTAEDVAESRWKTWAKRAKDAVNGGLTKLYYGIGATMNSLAKNERKDGETDEEYNERMKRNGRRAAVGIVAVAAAWGAYRLYHGIESGSGGSGTTGAEHPFNPSVDPNDLGPDTPSGNGNAHSELLNSDAWNIPKGSGGEALMDRLGIDKSVWYEHQDDFLNKFPGEAFRMSDGNVGFDDPGRLSKPAIEFWAQYAGK